LRSIHEVGFHLQHVLEEWYARWLRYDIGIIIHMSAAIDGLDWIGLDWIGSISTTISTKASVLLGM
jgi:hypothetical protein